MPHKFLLWQNADCDGHACIEMVFYHLANYYISIYYHLTLEHNNYIMVFTQGLATPSAALRDIWNLINMLTIHFTIAALHNIARFGN